MILEYNLALNKLKILKYSSLTTIYKAVSKTRVIVFILNLKTTLEMKELKLGGGRMLDIWIMFKGGSRSHLFALLRFLVTLCGWVQRTSSDKQNTKGYKCIIWNAFASGLFPSSPNRTPEEVACSSWTGNSFLIWYYICFNAILPNHPTLSLFTESKRQFYTSVSLLLSCIQGYRYHLSKFHIYALVYCIGVFLSGLLHSV